LIVYREKRSSPVEIVERDAEAIRTGTASDVSDADLGAALRSLLRASIDNYDDSRPGGVSGPAARDAFGRWIKAFLTPGGRPKPGRPVSWVRETQRHIARIVAKWPSAAEKVLRAEREARRRNARTKHRTEITGQEVLRETIAAENPHLSKAEIHAQATDWQAAASAVFKMAESRSTKSARLATGMVSDRTRRRHRATKKSAMRRPRLK